MKLLSPNTVHTDVLCVKILKDYILIGNGYYLYMYSIEDGAIKKKIHIFDQHIFGIDVNQDKILIYGGRYIALYHFLPDSFDFKKISSHIASDWILVAKFMIDNHLLAITMHNVAILFDLTFNFVQSKECVERCISYCAHVINDNWNDLVVLSGTVFNQILLWRPSKFDDEFCPVISRLIGHKGVIFSIDYNPNSNLICTTSDDRTAKIWQFKDMDFKDLSESSIIICKCSLIGHSARVFKCKLLNELVITAGEDGTIKSWNFEGDLIKSIDVHQGGPVWCFDCCEERNIIVSAGGDSGVFLLKLCPEELRCSPATYTHEHPKKLLMLSPHTLMYLNEDGTLIHYLIRHDQFTGVNIHEDLVTYGLLERSPCGTLVALAGYCGNLYMYAYSRHLKHLYSCQITTKERIFSIHWLSCSTLLTCGLKGVLIMWMISKSTMFPIQFWQLPHSKERWSTAACFCGFDKVLVGNRSGDLFLYGMNSSIPLQIIKKAHNYLGVTYLFHDNGKIVSLGRNSMVNEYKIQNGENQIVQVTSHKVPFTWLTRFYKMRNNICLLIGFSGSNFVVYDYVTRRILVEIKCGGGHRSWDFVLVDDSITFSYIKDKKIHLVKYRLDDIMGVNIIDGFHLNEINSVKGIQVAESKIVLLSGGEDTVLRLSSLRDNSSENNPICRDNNFKSHLSSIRAIAIVKVAETTYYVFSGGGRSQIILWELCINEGDKRLSCSEKYNFYEKNDDGNESETRVMSLKATAIGNEVYLLSGYSNGNVKIFKVINSGSTRLKLHNMSQLTIYKTRCIFQIFLLTIGSRYILITMASDGLIIFTDITQAFSNVGVSSDWCNILSVKAHQSGINSFSHYNKNNKLTFLTGGDDTAIVLNAFDIKDDKLAHNARYHDESYHGAQVTGTYINERYFLTASVDQRVLLFKWDLFNDKFNVVCLQKYSSSICDIKGIEYFPSGNKQKLIIYGRGCEIINCDFK